MNVTFAAYSSTFQNRIMVCDRGGKKTRTIMTVIIEVTKKKSGE